MKEGKKKGFGVFEIVEIEIGFFLPFTNCGTI
jgi:hypothetical protein